MFWVVTQCGLVGVYTNVSGEHTVSITETLLSTYESTRCHKAEQHRHLHSRENFKSHLHFLLLICDLQVQAIATTSRIQRGKYKIQSTLDYPGADWSVCGLSMHDSFFNLQSIWFIKLRTTDTYTGSLVHKSGYFPVFLISWCTREHTRSGSVWEEHVSQSVSS
jgi:hypothetical protein